MHFSSEMLHLEKAETIPKQGQSQLSHIVSSERNEAKRYVCGFEKKALGWWGLKKSGDAWKMLCFSSREKCPLCPNWTLLESIFLSNTWLI